MELDYKFLEQTETESKRIPEILQAEGYEHEWERFITTGAVRDYLSYAACAGEQNGKIR